MKSMKNLKEAPSVVVDTMINAYPFFTVLDHGIARFFTVLAHGIARSFMVDLLGWRLAISSMVRSV